MILLEKEENFQSFGMHPTSPQLEGKHSELWHIIFLCHLKTVTTRLVSEFSLFYVMI